IRRTRAGDAWDRAEAASCEVPSSTPSAEPGRVSLGLPTLRVATIPIYDTSDGMR
ncbi:MAG: tRNA (N6-isopentenyl adenosine(37)-C2)-methylthiotransferase MiaB, partial [Lacisediminihabitans sp.]